MIGCDLGQFVVVCDSLCLYVTVSDAVGQPVTDSDGLLQSMIVCDSIYWFMTVSVDL